MKKTFAILFAALAFAACSKTEVPVGPVDNGDTSNLVFNFTVHYPGETKAVKSSWTDGDKISIFFEDITSGYVTMTYSSSTGWGDPTVTGSIDIEDLTEKADDKHFRAIYLPYGNDAVVELVSTDWIIPAGKADSYFLTAYDYYTVTKAGGITTLSAVLDMAAPFGFVQFFIPDAEATGTIRMACNELAPYTVIGIYGATLGICDNTGNKGDFVTGYAATIGGDTGWYFSGRIADPGNEYYFAVEAGANYYDYYAHLAAPLAERAAKKLPALASMSQVGPGRHVTFSLDYSFEIESTPYEGTLSTTWSTVNRTAEKPWTYTETLMTFPGMMAGSTLEDGEVVPNSGDWDKLMMDTDTPVVMKMTNHYWMPNIGGVAGMLFVGANDSSKHIFLPATGFSTESDSGISRGYQGFYWTCESDSGDDSKAYCKDLNSSYISTASKSKTETWMSVRAIHDPSRITP